MHILGNISLTYFVTDILKNGRSIWRVSQLDYPAYFEINNGEFKSPSLTVNIFIHFLFRNKSV